jgi:hypothetical protein
MGNFDYAQRVTMSDGDYPIDDKSTLKSGDWNNTTILQPWDAIESNGVLRPQTGSKRPCYATYMTRRKAVSQMKVTIVGTYRKISLKLPGLEYLFDNAPNGWLDLTMLYDGYDTPGSGRNSNGCALGIAANGGSGLFIATFGRQSSTNSSNNTILVRIKLEALDVIKGITLEGMVENPDIVW